MGDMLRMVIKELEEQQRNIDSNLSREMGKKPNIDFANLELKKAKLNIKTALQYLYDA